MGGNAQRQRSNKNAVSGVPHAWTAPYTVRMHTILVVDDDVDGADTLAALLELVGHRTTVVRSGSEVVEAVRRTMPDLILMDINLPGIGGYEVARLIKEDALLRGIALVAFTGWGGDAVRSKAREAGFDAFLLKPARLDDLRRVFSEVLPRSL
jgi:CheY-like chemotaxis protein